ncbi:MAG: glycosyltransferase family 9 protein [Pseudomonas sp.]|nr:glycosyltransferase family 9 protein [Pseudomonas sp.]
MSSTAPNLAPRRVVIFRALMLGDMLCATPALRAFREAWPQARISLIGLPWAQELVRRLDSVDDFEAFPGGPGFAEQPLPDPAHAFSFMQRMRSRRFDLAIQLHGSGQVSNALVARLGARCNAGFAAPNAWFPVNEGRRFCAWPERGNEITRLLSLAGHLQLPLRGVALDLPLKASDHARAQQLVYALKPYAVVHAGSQLASRRWRPDQFAAVADRLVQAGLSVVLTGTRGERHLVDCVAALMMHKALNLCGKTDLWTLGAVLSSARLLVCNDTGLSHMAAALATPSVVVACGSDTSRWAPLDTRCHRVLWHDVACRPCAYRDCPTDHACAAGVSVQRVVSTALELVNERAEIEGDHKNA